MDDELVFGWFKIRGGLNGELVHAGLFDAVGGLPCLVAQHCGGLERCLDVFCFSVMGDGSRRRRGHIHALHLHGVHKGNLQLHVGVLLVGNRGGRGNDHAKMGLGLGSPHEQQSKAGAANFPHRKFLLVEVEGVAAVS